MPLSESTWPPNGNAGGGGAGVSAAAAADELFGGLAGLGEEQLVRSTLVTRTTSAGGVKTRQIENDMGKVEKAKRRSGKKETLTGLGGRPRAPSPTTAPGEARVRDSRWLRPGDARPGVYAGAGAR